MGMSATRTWTREEVLALPDDGDRYELVDGELLVSPAPRGRHQRAVFELALIVLPYVRAHRLGALMALPGDLDLQSAQLVQPDLFVGAMVDGREPVEWEEFGIPILIAEVLSPSTTRYDREVKRSRYQRSGVPVYWIMDLEARRVEVWTPEAAEAKIVSGRLTWQPSATVPALEIDLPDYFGRVWGEAGR
jgi:Uma2 family endonuclease